MKPRRRVLCFQQHLTHYREAFFERAREALAERGIEFHLAHGRPNATASKKGDAGNLPWARVVDSRAIDLGPFSGVWLPTPSAVRDADLIIVTQENKLLANYVWLVRRMLGPVKVAYWGHGANFQSDAPGGLREQWKRMMLTRVDWWFAYTELTRDILLKADYPNERITVLDNAIDNEAFRADLDSVTETELAELRSKVSHGDTPVIGLFCGSLYPDKRIGYMIEAADRISAEIPDFSLVVIGDGPSAEEVKAAAANRPWLHWVGVRKGPEKAAYFRLANVVLNPGLVGLHVLDSFCAGVPMVTTAEARHSPEIAYLKHTINGLVVSGDPARYADSVIGLLRDAQCMSRLRAGALEASQRYTLKNMVEHFADGIERCLAMDKKR